MNPADGWAITCAIRRSGSVENSARKRELWTTAAPARLKMSSSGEFVGAHALVDPCQPFAAVPGRDLLPDEVVDRRDRRRVHTLVVTGSHDVGEIGELQTLLARNRVVAPVDDLRVPGEGIG